MRIGAFANKFEPAKNIVFLVLYLQQIAYTQAWQQCITSPYFFCYLVLKRNPPNIHKKRDAIVCMHVCVRM